MPAEAPQLSCFNGKEPFGPLRSFSALLTVPAGRFSELLFFNAKEPLGHLRSFSALLEVPAVHVPADAPQLTVFTGKEPFYHLKSYCWQEKKAL